jgi:uroporphyrinogen-III synthase
MNNPRLNILISRPLVKLESARSLLPSNKFNVHPCPTIDIHSIEKEKSHKDIFSQINEYDYLIFTSQYAVIETIEYLNFLKINPKQYNSLIVCAVGPMVSEQLNKLGLLTHMLPQKYTAQSLASLFPQVRAHSKKVLLPKGNRSAGMLELELSKKGYDVMSPVIYITELRNRLDELTEKLIYSKKADCIALTSPSSVIALTSILEPNKVKTLLNNVTIAAIGPSTSKACNDAGLRVDILPNEYTVQGMARAIANFYSKKGRFNR